MIKKITLINVAICCALAIFSLYKIVITNLCSIEKVSLFIFFTGYTTVATLSIFYSRYFNIVNNSEV